MSMFLAPLRQPVMHAPHSVQVLRRGPAPPKYGSGASFPGVSPKKTPTRVGWYVSPRPIRSATFFIAMSAGVMVGLGVTPSIRSAWS